MTKRDSAEASQNISKAHVDSFDTFIRVGLTRIVESIEPVTVTIDSSNSLKCWFDDVQAGRPEVRDTKHMLRTTPKACRESGSTYTAPLAISISWSLNDSPPTSTTLFNMCQIPVMVGSRLCELRDASAEKLVSRGEESNEFGGYFIVSGIERVIRLLIQQRRHYVMALVRSSFRTRGSRFTKYATAIRCVDECERSSTVRLHYLSDGSVNVGVTLGRQEIFLPLALVFRALTDLSDYELQSRVLKGVLVGGKVEFGYAQETLEKIFETAFQATIRTRTDALEYVGSMFKAVFPGRASSILEVGERIMHSCIFVHLRTNGAKSDLLIFMLNKLLSLVSGNCKEDNPDSLVHQEILLPGFLLQNILHEKLNEALLRVKSELERIDRVNIADLSDDKLNTLVMAAIKRIDVGRQLEYFLATGNLVSKTGLGLSQTSGFTIVAEKLNYLRYISHFRSIHRGAYFAELRTTTVRKLLPESWGFMCPVHTPDGSPCGLLTHMSASCQVAMGSNAYKRRSDEVFDAVVETISRYCRLLTPEGIKDIKMCPVLVDGLVLGYIPVNDVWAVASTLRYQKVSSESIITEELEIAVLPDSEISGAYPCLVIFSGSSRLLRPVRNEITGTVELIGTMEQNSLNIALSPEVTTNNEPKSHSEISPGQVLSIVASLTPWSDFNQSPRNMYQCQMAKQTMGMPLHTFASRSDTKLYRLHIPQRPIALTMTYDKYCIDSYPLGTNAVVAVLSHTGYDMEDAMIVNKSAVERGFAHSTLYKTNVIQLRSNERFQRNDSQMRQALTSLDEDGLPYVGQRLVTASTIYETFDEASSHYRHVKLKGADEACVDKIKRVCRESKSSLQGDEISITLRYNRNPVIGDKFSSRHGQKGVLSFLWPDEGLPFIERSGVRPDILINPHAFPSRMTIGMLVESLASKSGALTGDFVDASAFKAEKVSPLDTQGETLRNLGYNYTGSETMINGVTGEPFEVDIYIGLVYYQRLRHMVSDKFQVRSTGPVNPLTKQPIKGRKAGGGVRFGEMERDSLLAHGAAYLLRDRLHLSSDTHLSSVCTTCGNIISTVPRAATGSLKAASSIARCQVCETSSSIEVVALPYGFKYLAAELAAMNIQMKVSMI